MNMRRESNTKCTNGRVSICQEPKTKDLFALYDKIPSNEPSGFREPTLGLWDDTTLSKLYFSKENVSILQNGIRFGVYQMSKGQYTVDNQDIDSLKIIMRSIFLQHSSNMCDNITEQIEALNKLVLQFSVKQVYGEAQGYIKYLHDASNMYTPIAPPVMSSTSDKQLFLKTFF
jgi:hypothetical protein